MQKRTQSEKSRDLSGNNIQKRYQIMADTRHDSLLWRLVLFAADRTYLEGSIGMKSLSNLIGTVAAIDFFFVGCASLSELQRHSQMNYLLVGF